MSREQNCWCSNTNQVFFSSTIPKRWFIRRELDLPVTSIYNC